MEGKRVLIVGGGAGGASCAARIRRLSEEAEIIIFDRSPSVSSVNCSLPYKRFNIEVRLESNVLAVDPQKGEIKVKDLKTGELYRERYDALVLSTGTTPVRPLLPGLHLPGIFSLGTPPDSLKIRDWIEKKKVKQAIIVGGGSVGIEMAENLSNLGILVTILEMLPQLMPALDPEMAKPLEDHLRARGISLHLGNPVTGFEQNPDGTLSVNSTPGLKYSADMVILSIGVKPEISLARDAGLKIGSKGGIFVDNQMRTSDRRIWAVGDAVEVRDLITGESELIAMPEIANRQGKVAADSILGLNSDFRGAQASTVCSTFGMNIATTGASEKRLRQLFMPYEKVYSYQGNPDSYYPNAKQIRMKLLFSPLDGRILGAQAVGEESVEKQIDIISMVIEQFGTLFDLEKAELCNDALLGVEV